jgi:hypothetical protein
MAESPHGSARLNDPPAAPDAVRGSRCAVTTRPSGFQVSEKIQLTGERVQIRPGLGGCCYHLFGLEIQDVVFAGFGKLIKLQAPLGIEHGRNLSQLPQAPAGKLPEDFEVTHLSPLMLSKERQKPWCQDSLSARRPLGLPLPLGGWETTNDRRIFASQSRRIEDK